mmetsp:Transcript_33565/g.87063  ORF Transcript_33565/g.87063 Transcript_33565/m.87063 type:complete len:217 (+) Transcript_33565:22-672(+)
MRQVLPPAVLLPRHADGFWAALPSTPRSVLGMGRPEPLRRRHQRLGAHARAPGVALGAAGVRHHYPGGGGLGGQGLPQRVVDLLHALGPARHGCAGHGGRHCDGHLCAEEAGGHSVELWHQGHAPPRPDHPHLLPLPRRVLLERVIQREQRRSQRHEARHQRRRHDVHLPAVPDAVRVVPLPSAGAPRHRLLCVHVDLRCRHGLVVLRSAQHLGRA